MDVNMDYDMASVDSMLSVDGSNLAELLAQDLELSSNVFVSKNMTAGPPQASFPANIPRRSVSSGFYDDDDEDQDEDDDMMAIPGSGAFAGSNMYEVMMRVKQLGSIAESSTSLHESLSMLHGMGMGFPTSAHVPLSSSHPSAATRRDDESMSESIYSSNSGSFDVAMEPPIVRLSDTAASVRAASVSPPASPSYVAAITNGSSRWSASPSIRPASSGSRRPASSSSRRPVSPTSRRPVSGHASISSRKSDPESSWIADSDDSDNDNDVEISAIAVKRSSSHYSKCSSISAFQSQQANAAVFSSKQRLASPPATPPRSHSPDFGLPSSTFMHTNVNAMDDYRPGYEPLSPPRHPSSSSSSRPSSRDQYNNYTDSQMSSSRHGQYACSEKPAITSRRSSLSQRKPAQRTNTMRSGHGQMKDVSMSPVASQASYQGYPRQPTPLSRAQTDNLYERRAAATPLSSSRVGHMAMFFDDDEQDLHHHIPPTRARTVPMAFQRDHVYGASASHHRVPDRVNTPESWKQQQPKRAGTPMSMESGFFDERRTALPLPPDVADNLRVNVACFPETMLTSSSLTVETIRAYSRKLKHDPLINSSERSRPAAAQSTASAASASASATGSSPPPKKWSLHRALGSRRGHSSRNSPVPAPDASSSFDEPRTSAAAAVPWAALRTVFAGASDDLCDALYAHILAYNYISNLCPRAAAAGHHAAHSASVSVPTSAHSNASSLLNSPMHARHLSGSYENLNDIPKKAAHLLGLNMDTSTVRSSSPVPSSKSRGGARSKLVRAHQSSQSVSVSASSPTAMFAPAPAPLSPAADQAMRDLQVGLARCIARLVATLKTDMETAGGAGYAGDEGSGAEFADEMAEIEPVLLRSLCEIVRCCEEAQY